MLLTSYVDNLLTTRIHYEAAALGGSEKISSFLSLPFLFQNFETSFKNPNNFFQKLFLSDSICTI